MKNVELRNQLAQERSSSSKRRLRIWRRRIDPWPRHTEVLHEFVRILLLAIFAHRARQSVRV
jgi:hypothetical protein